MELSEFFAAHPKLALGFSGGTDSAYLLYEAVQNGVDIRPYYVQTQFQPQFELDDARRLCDQLGVQLCVIEIDVLADEQVRANPADRCYWCKSRLFGTLLERARADGYGALRRRERAAKDTTTDVDSLSPEQREAAFEELELRDISDRKLRKVLRDLDAQLRAIGDAEGE